MTLDVFKINAQRILFCIVVIDITRSVRRQVSVSILTICYLEITVLVSYLMCVMWQTLLLIYPHAILHKQKGLILEKKWT